MFFELVNILFRISEWFLLLNCIKSMVEIMLYIKWPSRLHIATIKQRNDFEIFILYYTNWKI